MPLVFRERNASLPPWSPPAGKCRHARAGAQTHWRAQFTRNVVMFLCRTSGRRACPHALPLLSAVRSTQTYLTEWLTFNVFLQKNLPAPANPRHTRFRPFGRSGGQAYVTEWEKAGGSAALGGANVPQSGLPLNLKVREPSGPRTFEAWISSEICQCPSGKRLSRLGAFNARAS